MAAAKSRLAGGVSGGILPLQPLHGNLEVQYHSSATRGMAGFFFFSGFSAPSLRWSPEAVTDGPSSAPPWSVDDASSNSPQRHSLAHDFEAGAGRLVLPQFGQDGRRRRQSDTPRNKPSSTAARVA